MGEYRVARSLKYSTWREKVKLAAPAVRSEVQTVQR